MGITLKMFLTYRPESNGLAEPMNPTISDNVRALIKQVSLPEQYYCDALQHAAYLLNCTATSTLGMCTPYEIPYGSSLNNLSIRISSCAAYLHVHKQHNKNKLDIQAEK